MGWWRAWPPAWGGGAGPYASQGRAGEAGPWPWKPKAFVVWGAGDAPGQCPAPAGGNGRAQAGARLGELGQRRVPLVVLEEGAGQGLGIGGTRRGTGAGAAGMGAGRVCNKWGTAKLGGGGLAGKWREGAGPPACGALAVGAIARLTGCPQRGADWLPRWRGGGTAAEGGATTWP